MSDFTMNFDLGADNLSNGFSNSILEGNKIHNVIFKGVEFSKSKSGEYEFIVIKFSGEEGGFFTHRGFGLREKSGERRMTAFGENPSEFESFMMTVKHLLHAVAPQLLKDMIDKKIVFTPKKGGDSLFQQYVEFISQNTLKYVGVKTQIKLVKNKKGEACFPMYPVGISKDGKVYMKTNFIGENLLFTNKELENIALENSAKPTKMKDDSFDVSLGDSEATSEEPETEESDEMIDLAF